MERFTEKVALVVEDELFARLFAAQLLSDEGFIVMEAADAAEGLQALEREEDIALLFTDVRMPGEIDGIALAEAAHRRRPDISLVLTSGDPDISEDDVPDCGRFLRKPYTPLALKGLIRDIVRQ